ncbi:calcium-transporting ATPase [Aureococcus anophagefferens]|nr:calcium-transporting ATPase [Aureococcus anophagefferens]
MKASTPSTTRLPSGDPDLDGARGHGRHGRHAIGVVAATGMATQIGRIQAGVTAAAADQQKTPLSQKLDEFGHQLTLIIGSVCALTFGASVPRFDSPIFGSKLRGAMHYAKGAVALGVAAIPEGLPAVITPAYRWARGAWRSASSCGACRP